MTYITAEKVLKWSRPLTVNTMVSRVLHEKVYGFVSGSDFFIVIGLAQFGSGSAPEVQTSS